MTKKILNLDWFRERLADLSLLDRSRAVILELDGWREIAVPVGGTRLGGYISCGTVRDAKEIMRQLEPYPDLFPHLRFEYSVWRDVAHVIAWGPIPPEDNVERGRFYGYREDVIRSESSGSK
jgi:hypothetical protein